MTLKLILAFVIAFAVSAVVGFFLVPYLRRIKAGQSIKETVLHGTCPSRARPPWAG